ncbi:Ff.00g114900.m01.CDS01 [Fusarium sp. VM40]|nr:Ff.00g114900.m01.CDS01 [Fusarium sp. VM40]
MPSPYPFNLGNHTRPITTSSPSAQLWFDRGLIWANCYNHEEASRCFIRAAEHDPECAMAYWGHAYAIGPNYNKAWIRYDRQDLVQTIQKANSALDRAESLAHQSSPVEKALVKALRARFPDPNHIPEEIHDMTKWDVDYADAMRPVYRSFSDDTDVVGIFVEALISLSPRALWDLQSGEPAAPHTVEAREAIEPALNTVAGRAHPALPHLYIHLMEMSPFPQLALPAADLLRRVVPDGSHMYHMATHIDAAVGRWDRVIESNDVAAEADDVYFSLEKGSILYTMYRAHNVFTKAYGGIMAGRFQVALEASRRLYDIITPELLSIQSPPLADWIESLLGTIAHTLVRFGRWEDILLLEIPTDQNLFVSTTAMIRYAKAIALAVLGRIDEAEAAQAVFEQARDVVPFSRLNSLPARDRDVLKVGSAMLKGELEYRKGNFDDAFQHLREAVRLEDALPYSDPPSWLQPSRHALGALLLEQGRVGEAEKVYRDDLGFGKSLPRRRARINNVFGLHGLYECLTALEKSDEAQVIKVPLDIALASADVDVKASCFCRLNNLVNTNGRIELNSCCLSIDNSVSKRCGKGI